MTHNKSFVWDASPAHNSNVMCKKYSILNAELINNLSNALMSIRVGLTVDIV